MADPTPNAVNPPVEPTVVPKTEVKIIKPLAAASWGQVFVACLAAIAVAVAIILAANHFVTKRA